MTSDTLFVSDLDGTLLNENSELSTTTVTLLNEAIGHGAAFSIATARTPATVVPLLARLNLQLPLIVMTGAAMWHPREQRFIEPQFLTAVQSEKTRAICRRFDIRPFVYTLSSDKLICTYHNGPMSKRERAFIDERSHLPLKRVIIDHPDGLTTLPSTILLFALGEKDTIMDCAEAIKTETDCTVSAYNDIFNHKIAFLEVFARGVSKASAMKRLMEMTETSQSIVFGDNLNDLAMMAEATHSVAVENAFPEVKLHADETIGPNTSDSVARYINEKI